MRGSFRREAKKVQASKRSGAGADDLYKPHLWYFDYFSFLEDQEFPRQSQNNIDDESTQGQQDELAFEDDVSLTSPTASIQSISRPSTSCSSNEQTVLQTTSKAKRSKSKADEVLEKVAKKLDDREDQFDVIGKNVANKLRQLPAETALIAEKLIADVLFEAKFGTLTRHSKMHILTNEVAVQPVQQNINYRPHPETPCYTDISDYYTNWQQ